MVSKYMRFDWAMKRLLRNEVCFSILEGLLTTLLQEQIKIYKLLECESDQEDKFDKYNRIDVLAKDSQGEFILIEVQNNSEYAYFQRILFETSKLMRDYINRREGYANVRKIYCVNIVYFSLMYGKDTIYYGKTELRGIHEDDILEVTPFQRQTFCVDSQLYPEYYILKVNNFNKVANSPLDEWFYYLNTSNIPDNVTAPGLAEAREHLKLERMTSDELKAYYRYLDNIVILRDNIYMARAEGQAELFAEGIEKGREEERFSTARKMKAKGLDNAIISEVTGLSNEEIDRL